jgi:hypothetical protein
MKIRRGRGWLARTSPDTPGMQSKVHPTYKTKCRVANWPAYNLALVRRGDVTAWLAPEASPAGPLAGMTEQ